MHSSYARALIAGFLMVGCGAFPAFSATAADLHVAQSLHFANMWTPTTGHTDAFNFDPITTPGSLRLYIHSDNPTLEGKELNDTLFVANDTKYSDEVPGRTKFQLTAPHPVLGGQAGNTVWILPQDFTEFSPGYDRVAGVTAANGWSAQTIVLNSVTAPTATARFAVWTSSGTVRFSSTGNTTTPQAWNTGSPAHGHMSWGFTETGLYVLSFVARITGPSGILTSPTYTVNFCVIGEAGNEASVLQTTCGITPGDGDGGTSEGSGSVAVSATIASCGVAMSVGAKTATLSGGTVEGGLRTYTGTLPKISILSCQQGAWTVNGIASDFTSGSTKFSSSRLGWTPSVGAHDLTVSAGPAVAPGPNATDGLKISRVLGAAHNENGSNFGTAEFGAALTLKVPGSTAPGTYASTLTLTAISGG